MSTLTSKNERRGRPSPTLCQTPSTSRRLTWQNVPVPTADGRTKVDLEAEDSAPRTIRDCARQAVQAPSTLIHEYPRTERVSCRGVTAFVDSVDCAATIWKARGVFQRMTSPTPACTSVCDVNAVQRHSTRAWTADRRPTRGLTVTTVRKKGSHRTESGRLRTAVTSTATNHAAPLVTGSMTLGGDQP